MNPDTIVTKEMIAKADKCPFCGASVSLRRVTVLRFKCDSWIAFGHAASAGRGKRCLKIELDAYRDLAQRLSEDYSDLVMRVGRKFDGETRHQTAARYIDQAESQALMPEPVQAEAKEVEL